MQIIRNGFGYSIVIDDVIIVDQDLALRVATAIQGKLIPVVVNEYSAQSFRTVQNRVNENHRFLCGVLPSNTETLLALEPGARKLDEKTLVDAPMVESFPF